MRKLLLRSFLTNRKTKANKTETWHRGLLCHLATQHSAYLQLLGWYEVHEQKPVSVWPSDGSEAELSFLRHMAERTLALCCCTECRLCHHEPTWNGNLTTSSLPVLTRSPVITDKPTWCFHKHHVEPVHWTRRYDNLHNLWSSATAENNIMKAKGNI